jgi:Uma2 family endonuclease
MAPCDVVLSPNDVVAPDVFFVRAERLSIIGERNVNGAPDLVIEILSPATEHRDRTMKTKLYARSGVRELWIVVPSAKTVEIFSSSGAELRPEWLLGAGQTLRSGNLPGLEMPLSRVF